MTTFASFDFTGSDSSTIQSIDANWTFITSYSSNCIIDSNRGQRTSTTSTGYYYNEAPSSADYSVSLDIYRVSEGGSEPVIGPAARCSSSANTMYLLRQNLDGSDKLELYRVVAGSFTLKASSFQAGPSTGNSQKLTLDVSGTDLTGYIDDVEILSSTDSSISAAGFPGFRGYTLTNFSIDNFSADEVGGGTVTGTGALASGDAAIAGTGTTTRVGTGALASDVSVISGTGTVSGAVTGTASLESQDSSISGTGVIERVGTGDVQSQDSAISATGAVGRVGTGAISADSSSIAGTGTVTEVGTVTGTGALTSQDSELSASGIIGRIGTGSIIVDLSQISATGVIGRTGTGALTAQSSTIAGIGSIPGEVTGTASLACGESSIYGVGTKSGWTEVPSAGGSWATVSEVTTIWTEI